MERQNAPLVSLLLAVHNGAPYVETAIRSVLRQTLRAVELVVVDDASTDETPAVLARIGDTRVNVLGNQQQLGLAGSLNVALRHARARYVARLDADDVALPDWLERLVSRIRSDSRLGVVGSAMLDIDDAGRPGRLHVMPASPRAVRWHALYGAPFFHSTVLVDRDVLERNRLTYDTTFLESEDYDLWARLLKVAEGANVETPLVLHRRHPAQASERRGDLQRSHQREIAVREIRALAPHVDAERAWAFGIGQNATNDARSAYRALLHAFEQRYGSDPEVRVAAARTLVRGGSMRDAPAVTPHLAEKAKRWRAESAARRRARAWLAALGGVPLRVVVVSPEPTPYRAPLFDRIGACQGIDLTVVYAARTVAGRTWSVDLQHRALFLAGVRVPGMQRLVRHDYPLTPGIVGALAHAAPDVVVVSGWSTFSSQAAVAWCLARRVPYVLLVESHDLGPRAGWRRAVKGAVVPRLVRGAAGALAVGTAATASLVARGADPDRVRIFANTIDVRRWVERAESLRARRAPRDEVVVLSVARLAPEKGIDVLVRAAAAAENGRLRVVVAGQGPERARLEQLARSLGVRLTLAGDLGEDALAHAYADADIFALLSRREPWGVVVNEAAASGLPLIVTDRVGAAADLIRHGENGFVVPAGDVPAAAEALRALLASPDRRQRFGRRSRELVSGWGYEPSVEAFVAAVRDAASR